MTQNDFEILLYSFRFILNSQIGNKKCFYNEILKEYAKNFINNNFIPGAFILNDEYQKSYNLLTRKLEKNLYIGYYICKDCGFLYEVRPNTFPMKEDKCPNGHIIGGLHHKCSKQDIRVFKDIEEYNKLYNIWKEPDWFGSFKFCTLNQFKANYIDKNAAAKHKKGIDSNYIIDKLEENYNIRDINIITYKILNYI